MNNVRAYSLFSAILALVLFTLHATRLAFDLDVVFAGRSIPKASSVLFMVMGATAAATAIWLLRNGAAAGRNLVQGGTNMRIVRFALYYITALHTLLAFGQLSRLSRGAEWTVGAYAVPDSVSMFLLVCGMVGIYFGAGLIPNIKPAASVTPAAGV